MRSVAPLLDLRRAASRRSWLVTRSLARLDRSSDRSRDRSWSAVVHLLSRAAPARISVDVFDTVLTRRVVGDDALWWITAGRLQESGCWGGSKEDFITARRAAAAARPQADLKGLYDWPPLAAALAGDGGAAIETAVEDELAVPVPGSPASLQQLRDAGHRLTFVSDMHLAHGALWRSLERHGLASEGDQLVVSSDFGASKAAGTLFPALLRLPDPPAWHIGNDLWSDVAMAERCGLRALPARFGESSHLEDVLARGSGSWGSALAGAARQVRSGALSRPGREAALVEVGADVAAQCLSAFLLWAREQCHQAEVHQVLFLARDGELPMLMAQAMPEDHWDGLQLRYVHGSRRLWSVAAAAVTGVDAWLAAGVGDQRGFLRQNQHVIPWGSLLSRAALEPGDLVGHPLLQALPLDEPLPVDRDPAWRDLLADDRVREALRIRADRQLEDVQQVLRSTGVDGSRAAVVDVGWRGQLAWQVSAVLRDMTGHEPVHLHFGGVDVADDLHGADVRRFAVDDRRAPLPFPDFISCVETFTASGAARARTTERDAEGGVSLVFDGPLQLMQTEERRLLREAAVEVAGLLPSREALSRWGLHGEGLDRHVRDVLTEFWTAPTLSHATAASQLCSEVDDAGLVVRRVASPYSLADLTAGGSARTWRRGSLRLTRQPLRSLATVALRVKDRKRR